eukprot:g8225.t1
MHAETHAVYAELVAGAHRKVERAVGKIHQLGASGRRELELAVRGGAVARRSTARGSGAEALRPRLAVTHFRSGAQRRRAQREAAAAQAARQQRGVVTELLHRRTTPSAGNSGDSGALVSCAAQAAAQATAPVGAPADAAASLLRTSTSTRGPARAGDEPGGPAGRETDARPGSEGRQTIRPGYSIATDAGKGDARSRRATDAAPTFGRSFDARVASANERERDLFFRKVDTVYAIEHIGRAGPEDAGHATDEGAEQGGGREEGETGETGGDAPWPRHSPRGRSVASMMRARLAPEPLLMRGPSPVVSPTKRHSQPAAATAANSTRRLLTAPPTARTALEALPRPALSLAHFGIGDARSAAVARAVPGVMQGSAATALLGAGAGAGDNRARDREGNRHELRPTMSMKRMAVDVPVRSLDVSHNRLGAEALAKVLRALRGTHTLELQALCLGGNCLGGVGGSSGSSGDSSGLELAQLLCGPTALRQLVRLELPAAQVGERGLDSVVSALCGGVTAGVPQRKPSSAARVAPLQLLDVSRNSLGGGATATLARLLECGPASLHTLRAGWNQLGRGGKGGADAAAQALGNALSRNKTLKELDLSTNNFGLSAQRLLGALPQNTA